MAGHRFVAGRRLMDIEDVTLVSSTPISATHTACGEVVGKFHRSAELVDVVAQVEAAGHTCTVGETGDGQ